MKTIEQKEFEELASIPGSDCWNEGHIVRECLKGTPNANRIDINHRGTGLWCDVTVYYPVGDSFKTLNRKIFG